MINQIIEVVWRIIQSICVLYTFSTIIWKSLPRHWREQTKASVRSFLRKLKVIDESSILGSIFTKYGIHLIVGTNHDYGIEFSIDNCHAIVPEDFERISKRLEDENLSRWQEGKNPVFTDLAPYAVHSIVPERIPDSEDKVNERPMCHVVLRSSSYFYSLIAVEAMQEVVGPGSMTVREKYYSELIARPLNLTPQGYDIVHAFGMNTLVLTKDFSFVFCKRNRETVSTGQGCLHLSVGEHLNKDVLDLDKDGIPDAKQVIIKGLHQELGIKEEQVNRSNIRFYGIMFTESTCRYGTLGFTHLGNLSDIEIRKSWELSKDGRYEAEDLVFVKANIKSIVDYLNNNPTVSMTGAALLNACLALNKESALGRISEKQIDNYLKYLRHNAISQ